MCGGPDVQVTQAPPPAGPPPVAPSSAETTREAIAAQIESIPKILESQREFGPQFTQLQLEQLQQFARPFAEETLALQREFGVQGAEALRAEQEAAQPELAAARKTLTSFLGEEELLTPEEERQFLQDLRGAQNVRGFGVESGVGAEEELSRLTELRQNLKTRRLNIALATAGRAPITGASQISPSQTAFGPGQLVQNVTPSQIFGLTSSNFATQGSIFGSRIGAQASAYSTSQAAATTQRGQNLAFASNFIPQVSFGF